MVRRNKLFLLEFRRRNHGRRVDAVGGVFPDILAGELVARLVSLGGSLPLLLLLLGKQRLVFSHVLQRGVDVSSTWDCEPWFSRLLRKLLLRLWSASTWMTSVSSSTATEAEAGAGASLRGVEARRSSGDLGAAEPGRECMR
ncbi:hypothetical protein HYQ46_010085 [Verticillium longisporum]|nr:hypothetical protein HYQ46_010085 [Verticillium longisporum]